MAPTGVPPHKNADGAPCAACGAVLSTKWVVGTSSRGNRTWLHRGMDATKRCRPTGKTSADWLKAHPGCEFVEWADGKVIAAAPPRKPLGDKTNEQHSAQLEQAADPVKPASAAGAAKEASNQCS